MGYTGNVLVVPVMSILIGIYYIGLHYYKARAAKQSIEKAFNKLKFESFETADHVEYFAKRQARDEKAKNDYLHGSIRRKTIANDIFVIDIIRRGLKDGDPII